MQNSNVLKFPVDYNQ